jgi:hypothetical protein
MGFDAKRVIAMRLTKVSAGGAAADAECRRMVAEKIAAICVAQMAAAKALISGKGFEAATVAALAPIQRTVRANHRRLSRAEKIHRAAARLRGIARRLLR